MKTKILNITISIFILLFAANRLNAQMFAQRIEGNYAISYKLNQINQYISTQEPDLKGKAMHERLVKEGFYIKDDSILVSFEIHHIDETETIRLMNGRGATFHQVLEGEKYYSGFVQIDSLLRFPYNFSNTTIRMELKYRIPLHCSEGPIRTNSITYETGPVVPNAGAGVTIAILDGGWNAYNFAMANSKVPSVFTYYNCESGSCVAETIPGGNADCTNWNGCSGHGMRTAQTVFQHAPAATYLIYNTPDNYPRAAAIQHAANQGANIITCSQYGLSTGWDDNSGVLCSAVNAPNAANVLMFFAAGNSNNGQHWIGTFNDNGGDFHVWGGVNDVLNNQLHPVQNNKNYVVYIQCDNDGGGTTDRYKISIINTANFGILLQGSFSQSFHVKWPNNTGNPVEVGVVVEALTSFRPDFEMWVPEFSQLEYFSNSMQTSSPANCTNNPRVLTVAAVHQANFHLATTNAMGYSSRGPTNNNNPSVDIAGPTETAIFQYDALGGQHPGTYGGTSCATPNVAGAAAAFWSKHPGLTANQIKDILLLKAQNYKDWGPAGYDDTFGHGGAFLYTYYPNNIYLNQIPGNSGVVPANGVYPWYSIKDIHNLAPTGRNVIMLTNDNTTGPSVISKNMIINAAGNTDTNKRIE